MDSVPGRLNTMMFNIRKRGVMYGQCSEICGANHSFMPIVIEVLFFCSIDSTFSFQVKSPNHNRLFGRIFNSLICKISKVLRPENKPNGYK